MHLAWQQILQVSSVQIALEVHTLERRQLTPSSSCGMSRAANSRSAVHASAELQPPAPPAEPSATQLQGLGFSV